MNCGPEFSHESQAEQVGGEDDRFMVFIEDDFEPSRFLIRGQ